MDRYILLQIDSQSLKYFSCKLLKLMVSVDSLKQSLRLLEELTTVILCCSKYCNVLCCFAFLGC